jgi:hypothetical protein
MEPSQVLEISGTATSFTAVCEICLGIDTAVGYSASTFAGRLDLDIPDGVFLCRRGHQVTVVRAPIGAGTAQTGERTAA